MNIKLKKRIIIIATICLILLTLTLALTIYDKGFIKSSYSISQSDAIAIFVDNGGEYVSQNSVPVGNYKLNLEKSYCKYGGTIQGYDAATGRISFKISTGDKCYVYFDGPDTLSKKVLALESDSDYISSQDGSIYRVVNQNGVRYEGADPDNYVYYNCTNDNDVSTCERWRIIGTFDGSEIGLTAGKKYTKIIRSIPLENKIAWDTDGENDWVNSSLNTYLNGTYLNGLSSTAQSMIAKENNTYSKWYLLGPTLAYVELYSQDWYLYERNTEYGKPGYKDGVQYDALGETTAAIGLMYPSDYGYAAYGASCDNELSAMLSSYDANDGACGSVDWLLNQYGSEWLITPTIGRSNGAFVMDSDIGGNVYDSNVNISDKVRPVLYLSADVVVDGGRGTYNEPYILSLNEYSNGSTLANTILASNPSTLSDDLIGGMYRYQGSDLEVNNFICFGTDDIDTCTSDPETFMYNIIGIEKTGAIKLIKTHPWEAGGVQYWGGLEHYMSSNVLNEYDIWYPLIQSRSWNSSDAANEHTRLAWSDGLSAIDAYSFETSMPLYNGLKFFLPYLHDFLFSSPYYGSDTVAMSGDWRQNSWIDGSDLNDYANSTWIATANSGNDAWAFVDNSDGGELSTRNITTNLGMRPTFYLETNVMYLEGSGTNENPYMIKLISDDDVTEIDANQYNVSNINLYELSDNRFYVNDSGTGMAEITFSVDSLPNAILCYSTGAPTVYTTIITLRDGPSSSDNVLASYELHGTGCTNVFEGFETNEKWYVTLNGSRDNGRYGLNSYDYFYIGTTNDES